LVVEPVAHAHVQELRLVHRLVNAALALLLGGSLLVAALRLRGFLGVLVSGSRWGLDYDVVVEIVVNCAVRIEFVLLVALILQVVIILALYCTGWYPTAPSNSIGPKLAVITTELIGLDLLDLIRVNLVYVLAVTLDDLDQRSILATLHLL